ncbi:long-chain fatty acid--CoA ligase [Conexibacter sp. S30A1]|jgi:long-chain acyl-CoA synthetase|uniref:long-chain-fatty-acid--CoA ligase n=1 Tax=Conexibacter sp. S30A1 TaxID=2937800 RepID=UPI00200E9B8C|nr:long-chain fatty acid--CoA ligase [Conexibacter sp. S30A1]
MNLAAILSDAAAQGPERLAVKLDDYELSYGLLEQAAMRLGGLLRAHGLQPGDRVALMLPNVPYFPAIYYGALAAGAIAVPLNVLNKRREVEYYLRDCGAKLMFVWHDFAGEAQPAGAASGCETISVVPGEFEQTLFASEPAEGPIPREPDDTAVLLYTSGTTGHPKGAELTHANLLSNCAASRDLFALDAGVVVLGALPLFHSFGQTCAMNSCVLAGGLLTLLPRFEPRKALEIIERDRVSVFVGVPSMYGAMLNLPDRDRYDTSALRVCGSGGASMPVELMRGFEQAFGCAVLEGYGLSETSPVASFNHPDRERKPGSVGTPIAGVEMRVVDEADHDLPAGEIGEIVVRGANVMKGYWNRPEATAEAMRGGWFHTGDLARVDSEGYFFIVDRKKDMIIRNGFNVYPREVEEVLYEHPAVREAAVVGVPHDQYGEEVGAAIALKQDACATAEELRGFVRERVAAFKYPRLVWIVDELPKGPTGKILKREIKPPVQA